MLLTNGAKVVKLTRFERKPHGFTGNAYAIIEEDGTKRLISYKTEVCRVEADGTFTRLWAGYSVSTANHIRMFAKEYAPRWLARLGMNSKGEYRGTFKSNWLALPVGL